MVAAQPAQGDRRPVEWLWPLGIVLVYALYARSIDFISDDGYIAFEHARNFAAGHGLVYNAGERVDGYICFLWVAVLGVLWRIFPGIDQVASAQLLGVAFGAAAILLVWRFARDFMGERGARAALAPALVAVHASFAAWATGGLEGTLLGLLLFASAARYARFLRDGGSFVAVPLLFALVVLTRLDAGLFFGLTSLHFLARELRSGGPWFRRCALWAALFLAVFVPYYAARWAWYGAALPNPVYAKVGTGSTALRGQLRAGWKYLSSYLGYYGYWVLLFPGLLFVFRRAREAWQGYFALLLFGCLGYQWVVGGDGLAFHRFIVPVVPILSVLVAAGLLACVDRAYLAWPDRRVWIAVAACLVVAVVAWQATRRTARAMLWPADYTWVHKGSQLRFPGDGEVHSYRWFGQYFTSRLAVAARWLDANAADGALVASTPAGSIAYYMRHPVIDMLGLNDAHIARTDAGKVGFRRAGHMKGDGRYVLERAPTHILLGNVAVMPFPISHEEMAERLTRKSEHELWELPEFHERYEHVSVQLADAGPFQWFTFYQRRDLAHDLPRDSAAVGASPVAVAP